MMAPAHLLATRTNSPDNGLNTIVEHIQRKGVLMTHATKAIYKLLLSDYVKGTFLVTESDFRYFQSDRPWPHYATTYQIFSRRRCGEGEAVVTAVAKTTVWGRRCGSSGGDDDGVATAMETMTVWQQRWRRRRFGNGGGDDDGVAAAVEKTTVWQRRWRRRRYGRGDGRRRRV